ncbi:DEAD/DEAH box helicase family protein [Methylorubrum extorquens]
MSESFFRSLSLVEDLRTPSRFSHYRPTRRATPILAAVLQPRSAAMVIAPYGSGKSLAAGVGALAVRGNAKDRELVEAIMPRVALVAPELTSRLRERLATARQGRVVVLSGHEPNPLFAIACQLGLSKAPSTLDGLSRALSSAEFDHVAVIWDEFGRHLEGLVADGRSGDMDFIQRLAERTVRSSGPTISLTLLLHQNLLAYASHLNETTRSEWRKIEGRFRVIRLVEDSQEIYSLIAEVVASLRSGKRRAQVTPDLVARVQRAQWFDGMGDASAIERVLSDVQPLTPGALQILPTLVARVGQNERSLFSFLREVDLSRPVGVEQVYLAFSDAMRSDVGIGGSYRRWVEAESARFRARDDLQRELIAAACLLQLGVSGERVRLPREVLELAVASSVHDPDDIRRAVDDLIAANLLLWRRHTDDVAVWHGADIDVGLRVKEERERQSIEFDLLTFLNGRFPAPNLRTPGHNARFGVNRCFRGFYTMAGTLPAKLPAGSRCGVAYVVARTREEIVAAREAIRGYIAQGMIYVIPQRPLEIESAALELVALEALRADPDFVASDPMVATELDELRSVAFEQLAQLLRPLLSPRGPAEWWAEGRRLRVTSDQPGTMAASELLNGWYAKTPKIGNEQLMRDQASRTMQTARVRIISGILERSDRSRLGLEEGDRSAEGSIYRTILERTGLHRHEERRFASEHEVEEPGLAEAWRVIAEFFKTPTGEVPRPLTDLTSSLQAPPIGLPAAVMPLLVAAGYKQFAQAVAIYRDGVYEADLLGFQFDQMVMQPVGFTMRVEAGGLRLREYLRELCYAFQHDHPALGDELVRRAYDAVQAWRLAVPDSARRTQKLAGPAQRLLQVVSNVHDPIHLLLRAIPEVFGIDGPELTVIAKVEQTRKAVDELRDLYAEEAVTIVNEAFRLNTCGTDDLLDAVRNWAHCFDLSSMRQRDDLRISDKAVLSKAVETANGRFSPKSFAGALSLILLKSGLNKWDDRSAAEFRTAIREARERIETAAIHSETPTPALRPIIAARIAELQSRLAQLDDTAPKALFTLGGVR